jgi:hypothetical protein
MRNDFSLIRIDENSFESKYLIISFISIIYIYIYIFYISCLLYVLLNSMIVISIIRTHKNIRK